MTNEEAIEYNNNLIEYMKIADRKSEYKFKQENYEALDMANQALKQQKVGQWLKTSLTQISSGDFVRGFMCSCCKYALIVDDFKYCPNCGAKMEVEE